MRRSPRCCRARNSARQFELRHLKAIKALSRELVADAPFVALYCIFKSQSSCHFSFYQIVWKWSLP